MSDWTRPPRIEGFPYDAPGIKYFITITLAHGQPELTESDEVPELILETINERCERFGFTALAAVVMPDHFHFLLQNTEGEHDLSRVIRGIKSKTTHLMWEHGYEGSVWQRKYFERYLRTREELEAKLRYISDNPANEGLITSSKEEWPWIRFWI